MAIPTTPAPTATHTEPVTTRCAAPPPPGDASTPAAKTGDGRGPGGSTVARRVAAADSPPPAINHPLYALQAVGAISGLSHVAHVAPWWFVAGGGLAAVAGATAANARWRHPGTAAYTALCCAATGAAAAVATAYGPWSGAGLGSLLLAAITLGPWYGYLRYRHNEHVAKELATQAAVRERLRADRKHHDWEAILAKAGAKDVSVCTDLSDGRWTHGERTFDAGFALALELGEESPTVRELAGYTPQIEKIAARRLTLTIRPGAIQLIPRGYAHEAEIIIPTRDILKETFPMPLPAEPRSVLDPIHLFVAVDGSVIGWTPAEDPHGMIVGKTNAGKSTTLQAMAVETTRCVDNVTWMIVGNKPVRNFAPWLRSFLKGLPSTTTGSGFVEPVIDWVAADIAEACRMLCDAYKAISIRQRKASIDGADKWQVSQDSPRITILIDESPDFLTNTTYKCKPYDWDGNTAQDDEDSGVRTGLSFSEILVKVVRLARSEGISLVFLTQRGTNSMVGADGGDLKSQITFRVGFKQVGWIEQNSTFTTEDAGVDVTTLSQGECYVEMDGYHRPILAKGYYPSPETITQAAEHNCAWSQPLDDYTANELDYYASRWTRPSQQDFLRQVCPDAIRTIPYQDQPDATTEHPQPTDTRPPQGTGDEYVPAAQEIELLEALYAADTADEPAGTPTHRPVIDPSLPEHTRQLLTLLARSDLLYDDWIATVDILELTSTELGWPTSTPGAKRVKDALLQVNVLQPPHRPKRDGKKLPAGYTAAHIRTALNTVTWLEQPGHHHDDTDPTA